MSAHVDDDVLTDELVNSFRPGKGLNSAATQSFLASFKGRNVRTRLVGGNQLEAATHDRILHCSDGVRLHCLVSEQPEGVDVKGRVVLIHGWEGSAYSVYLFSIATTLFLAGYDVVRLHLRDHGGSHHLNRDVFHAGLLTEVVDAICLLCEEKPSLPHSLIGYSLGGNLVLRAAAEPRLAGLAKAAAVCPVLNPQESFEQLLKSPAFYQRYFRKKMMRGLLAKQAAFPSLYNFDWVQEGDDFTALFDYFVKHLTPFGSAENYFQHYQVHEAALHESTVPIHILAADDDPVVPASAALEKWLPSAGLTWERTVSGGHCGFITDWWGRSWVDDRLLGWLTGKN